MKQSGNYRGKADNNLNQEERQNQCFRNLIHRILQLDSLVKPNFATDAAELGIMEEIVEFLGILYAENVAEQDILLKCVKQNNRIKSIQLCKQRNIVTRMYNLLSPGRKVRILQ